MDIFKTLGSKIKKQNKKQKTRNKPGDMWKLRDMWKVKALELRLKQRVTLVVLIILSNK